MLDITYLVQHIDGLVEDNLEQFVALEKKYFTQLFAQADNFKDGNKRIGASEIGDECDRRLYYSYHKYPRKEFNGRLLRLVDRGKLEEARFFAMLELAGITVHVDNGAGEQFAFSTFDNAFSGHADGVIEVDGKVLLLELKTSAEKYFKDIVKGGVKLGNTKHYAQMQVYMAGLSLESALYCVVNKNNDELYFEVVPHDKAMSDFYFDRAFAIINTDEIPRGIGTTPSFWKCRFCDYRETCFGE